MHIIFVFLILLGGDFITVAINIPLIAYHAYKFIKRPIMSGLGVYDPTTVMNGDILNANIKEGWIKLGFYMISFFYYLYW